MPEAFPKGLMHLHCLTIVLTEMLRNQIETVIAQHSASRRSKSASQYLEKCRFTYAIVPYNGAFVTRRYREANVLEQYVFIGMDV